ncbi:MAG: hypothetical protein GY739_21630 [Mesoflavibacter sp.]|nr:hypothetical protein [Mesoflavibacter sp.]
MTEIIEILTLFWRFRRFDPPRDDSRVTERVSFERSLLLSSLFRFALPIFEKLSDFSEFSEKFFLFLSR